MAAGGMASMPSGPIGQSSSYNFNIAAADLQKMQGMMSMMNKSIKMAPSREARKVGDLGVHASIAEKEVGGLMSIKGLVVGMIDRTQFLDESSQMAVKEMLSIYDTFTEPLL